jgi:hypothetical protein
LNQSEPAPKGGRISLEERISLARQLFASRGEALKSDSRIGGLLSILRENLEASREAMVTLGIVAACARCDEISPEGSCCSRGLENKYDSILLLINLMLGSDLPDARSRSDSCHFLGPRGCLLAARNMLCIDYLCPAVEQELGVERLMKIQSVSGAEIETIFLLGEEIKRVILR